MRRDEVLSGFTSLPVTTCQRWVRRFKFKALVTLF